jgi:hypothetical protein
VSQANAEEALKAATAPSSGTTSSGKGKEKDLSGVPEKEKEKDATKNFFKVLAAGGMIAEMREPKPEKQKGPVRTFALEFLRRFVALTFSYLSISWSSPTTWHSPRN